MKIDPRRRINSTFGVRGRLAKNLLAQGRMLEAEVEARSVLKLILERVGKYSFGTAKFTSQLANIIAAQGRFDDAQKLTQAIFEILTKLEAPVGSVIVERARVSSARFHAAEGEWSSAMAAFDAAKKNFAANKVAFDELVATRSAYHLSLVYAGRSKEAVELIERQLDAREGKKGDQSRFALTRGILGMAYAETGETRKALDAFAEAVPTLVSDSGRQSNESVMSGRWRLSVLDAYLNLLDDVRESELDVGRPVSATSEMFRISEVVRGGSVQTALSGSAARTAAGDERMAGIVRRDQDIALRLETLSETLSRLLAAPVAQRDEDVIASYHEEIGKMRAASAALREEMAERFPEYSDLVRPKALTPTEAARLLRPDESLVSIYVGKKKSLIWAVTSSGTVTFKSVDLGEAALSEIVARLRNAVDPGGIRYLRDIPRFDLDGAFELYRKLLEPVAASWKESKHLLVVADGALGQLPLSLLPTEAATERFDEGLLFRHYRSVRWLARSHSVTMLPSVASLQALRSAPVVAKERLPFIGFGDPFFSGQQAAEAKLSKAKTIGTRGISVRSAPRTRGAVSAKLGDLPRLPDTRTELLAVARALSADISRDVHLGAAANEAKVKQSDLSRYSIVSFATHGLVPGDLDGLEQPALALSAPEVTGGGGDGLLAMDEVLGLTLNADWAILSACNTAAADGKAAEAVSGLGRAFFYAGARSLLVSNWPVMSEATTQLMVRLFEQSGTLPRAESLRRARVQMIDELVARDAKGRIAYAYSHPIFWAPFVIVGDNGNRKPDA